MSRLGMRMETLGILMARAESYNPWEHDGIDNNDPQIRITSDVQEKIIDGSVNQ